MGLYFNSRKYDRVTALYEKMGMGAFSVGAGNPRTDLRAEGAGEVLASSNIRFRITDRLRA